MALADDAISQTFWQVLQPTVNKLNCLALQFIGKCITNLSSFKRNCHVHYAQINNSVLDETNLAYPFVVVIYRSISIVTGFNQFIAKFQLILNSSQYFIQESGACLGGKTLHEN